MSQQDRLNSFTPYDLIWATIKYDELLQDVLQNKILVDYGFCKKLLADSTDIEIQIYRRKRESLIYYGAVDESVLRKAVLKMLAK